MKRFTLVCLLIGIALLSFGCIGGNEDKEVSKKELVMMYNSLNSRYYEVLDFYEAVQNKKITRFDWRVIADSSKKSSQRLIESLKASDVPMAGQFTQVGEHLIALTEELEQHVDHGTKPDLSYKAKIEAQLEELKPEIDQFRKEILEKR